MFSNSGEKGLIRVRVDCGGKWFLISSYLLLSPQTDDRRPLSSGKRANLGQKQVYKFGQSCNLSGGQYRPLMISFQEGEEQWLWVEREEKNGCWKNLTFSTITMFQEGEAEWLRLERQRQPKEEEKNCLQKQSFFFFLKKKKLFAVFTIFFNNLPLERVRVSGPMSCSAMVNLKNFPTKI